MSCAAKQNWVEEKGTYSFCRGFCLANPVKSYEKLENLQIQKKEKMLSHTKNILHDAGQTSWKKLT